MLAFSLTIFDLFSAKFGHFLSILLIVAVLHLCSNLDHLRSVYTKV